MVIENSASPHEVGDLVAYVCFNGRIEVEYPATRGSVVDWVQERLTDMGADDVTVWVEEA